MKTSKDLFRELIRDHYLRYVGGPGPEAERETDAAVEEFFRTYPDERGKIVRMTDDEFARQLTACRALAPEALAQLVKRGLS